MDQDNMEETNSSLLPPEVLEHLLGFLPVASLRTSRLVNPNWAKASIVPMRKKTGPISFGFPAGIGGLHSPFSYTHENLEKFIACFRASGGNFPVSKFQITLSPFDNSTFKDDKILDSFFIAVSSTITELTLSFGLGQCRPKSWPGDHRYPKLSSLKLKAEFYPRCSNNPRIYAQETFDFVERIIGQAPKLKMVSLEFGERMLGAVGSCLEAISGREMLLKKITHLNVMNMFQMRQSEFSKLDSVHGLKLEALKLISGRQGYNNDKVKAFLESQADSLRTLEIERNPLLRSDDNDIMIKIPALRNLEYLKISQNIFTAPILSSGNFSALRRVHFESPEFLYLIFDTEPFESVEELNISGLTDNIGKDGLLRVSSIFPNVTKLGIIPASRELLLAVYEEFPNLMELQLNLEGSKSVDSIITGLNTHQLKALEMEMEASGNLNGDFWLRKVHAFNSESIASLQHLKILTLRTDAWTAPLEFGLVSSLVLKSMESLNVIHLGIRRFPSSDKRTLDVIRNLREEICVLYDEPPEPRKCKSNGERGTRNLDLRK